MKRIALLLLFAIAATAAFTVSAAEAQKREMRAAWVATVWRLDWPTSVNNASAQKAELVAYLDNLQAQNFNAIYFQVRTMCDAFYQSSYEPWSSYLTGTRGKNPGYDPLQYAVEQCHARGIQCHAWVNPYRWSTSNTDWNTAQDQELKNSGMLLTYDTKTILNPGLPATRQRIVNVIKEIITNYDVDGVVFDDYFYPENIPTNSSAPDYNLWNDSGVDMTFADWRRNNVNLMVADVYNMIQQTKPEVRFGISPAGVAGTRSTSASQHGVTPCPTGSDWQYNGIFSDPLAWLEQGTIDYISPQLYWKTTHSTNPFGPLTQWWSYIAKHYGRHHFASHSISFLTTSGNTTSDWAEVVKQINYSRQYTENNSPGVVLYSAKNINGNNGGVGGLGNYLLANAFPHPSMIPALTWKTAPGYDAPANLALNGNILTWAAQEGTLVKYSVYAVPADITIEDAMSTTFDGIKSDYLLGVTYSPEYKLPSDVQSDYWYAVCVIDGYGNESAPAYLGADVDPEDPNQPTPVTYNIEKVWEIKNLLFLTTAETRQGFGMNGKFYINDKSSSTILVVDENGLTGETFEGGGNVGCSRDEAGNIVVSNANFPNPWTSRPEIKVINPTTGIVKTYTLPIDIINFGRSDNMGFPKGNLLEDGELYLVGVNSGTSISRIAFTDGEIDTDNTYLADCDGVTPNSGTVLNYYTDLNGNEAILYVHRSNPVLKVTLGDDGLTATTISLPNKGNCNGAYPFIWDNKELVVYPTMSNYRDGFAVAEVNAAEPLAYVEQTATADANGYQADWLNAEVIDSRNVYIYQYYPGGHITLWRLTKQGGNLRGDADEDGTVTIADVTTLIDYILTGNTDGVNIENADCDRDDFITIADVTSLIDYILIGSWQD
jgi:uncharacterized lipoprotein YddW (UPF0748 family)